MEVGRLRMSYPPLECITGDPIMPVSFVITGTHTLNGDIDTQAAQLADTSGGLIAAHLAQFIRVVEAHHQRLQDAGTLASLNTYHLPALI